MKKLILLFALFTFFFQLSTFNCFAQTPIIHPTDIYGGWTGTCVSGMNLGYFHTEKINSRWWFIDPLGNPFWLRGVYDCTFGPISNDAWNKKYDTTYWPRFAMTEHNNRRLLQWGFNTQGEYSVDPPLGIYGDPDDSVKLPYVLLFASLQNAMFAPANVNLSQAIKDINVGVPSSTYNGNYSSFADIYDPRFDSATSYNVNYQNSGLSSIGGMANNPWIVGITADDADELWEFKSGSNISELYYSPNGAFMIACTNFIYTSAIPDTKLYSKYAWVNYLQNKYTTIAALNTAWNTSNFYTAFGDNGGYGTGTGVLDEDGRHSWMGNSDPYTLLATTPGVKIDLDSFLYQFAYHYAHVVDSSIRTVDTKHLVFCPSAINGDGTKSRDQVLRGLSDGGIDVFCYGSDPVAHGPDSASLANNNLSYDLLGKPAFIWYLTTANSDSQWAGDPEAQDLPNQNARGNYYRDVCLPNLVKNAKGTNGDYYMLGLEWWALYDDRGEGGQNYGLMTQNDNPYDGVQDVIDSSGFDQWGYHTGGEPGNYGDCITPITRANKDSLFVWLFNCPSGISDDNNTTSINGIKIYPNPATDKITISDLRFEILNLRIDDIIGNTVLEKSLVNNKTTIDVSSFPCGVYVLKVKTKQGISVKKFVKE